MSKRKYQVYTVVADNPFNPSNVFYNYKEAFSAYQREESATLYGTNDDDIEIIMSK